MVSHRHRSDIIKGDIPDMWSITIIAVQNFYQIFTSGVVSVVREHKCYCYMPSKLHVLSVS